MTKEITAKKLLKSGSAILLGLLIAVYGIWQGRDLLFGIRVHTAGITNGQAFTEPVVSLSGHANHASEMSVNGRFVPVAENGTWSDTIALLPGENIVTITAIDKFKRTKTFTYSVSYRAQG